MSSFYGNGSGNGGGVSMSEIKTLIKRRISISSTQPNNQQQGDYWFVIKSFSEENGATQESGG